MISCVEEFRAELASLSLVALAAGDPDDTDANRAAATVALGLKPEVEADSPGAEVGKTACSWCGRTDPEGGLTQDYPRPAPPPRAIDPATGQAIQQPGIAPVSVDNSTDMHCADEQACHDARDQRQWYWVDSQFRTWPLDWDKYQRMLEYQREQAARTRFGTGIYALTGPDAELSELELAALADVRDLVWANLQAPAAAEVTLAAPGLADPAAPAPVPVKFDPWGHTLRHARHHQHLLGHYRAHYPGVHDAASALGRKAVRARAG